MHCCNYTMGLSSPSVSRSCHRPIPYSFPEKHSNKLSTMKVNQRFGTCILLVNSSWKECWWSDRLISADLYALLEGSLVFDLSLSRHMQTAATTTICCLGFRTTWDQRGGNWGLDTDFRDKDNRLASSRVYRHLSHTVKSRLITIAVVVFVVAVCDNWDYFVILESLSQIRCRRFAITQNCSWKLSPLSSPLHSSFC